MFVFFFEVRAINLSRNNRFSLVLGRAGALSPRWKWTGLVSSGRPMSDSELPSG